MIKKWKTLVIVMLKNMEINVYVLNVKNQMNINYQDKKIKKVLVRVN